MATSDGFCDPAAEQLYDELMSRSWALHLVLGSSSTDVTRAGVREHLAAVAQEWVAARRRGDDVDADLEPLLWPSGARPDDGHAWWSTPLGQLVTTRPRPVGSGLRDVHAHAARR